MSTKLTELQGPDGTTIYVQYSEEESDELRAVGVFDNIGERTKKFQETLVSSLNGYSALVLDTVHKGMKDLRRPDSMKLEFGLQVGGVAGIVFITKGAAQANIKVTMEWSLTTKKE
jgi:hypothetical protein